MKRLLIVDDNLDHRLILHTILEAEGYECDEAEDGGSALAKLVAGQVDLVLTDLDMPKMNGIQFIAQMNQMGVIGRIPAILLTSQPSDSICIEAYKAGAHAVMAKPYDLPKLLEKVGNAIGHLVLNEQTVLA